MANHIYNVLKEIPPKKDDEKPKYEKLSFTQLNSILASAYNNPPQTPAIDEGDKSRLYEKWGDKYHVRDTNEGATIDGEVSSKLIKKIEDHNLKVVLVR